MSIKDILPKKDKKKKVEYYWALVIEPNWVQAGVWKIDAGAAHILASSTPNAWSSDSDLVSASDAALSSAVKKLDEMEDEPSKTVFGVVSSWVEDGEIKGRHLEEIKKICEKLDLQPVGFVVIPEAVAHFIKSQEGSPLNALVLGVFEGEIEITIFRLGEILSQEVVSRSVSIVDDLSEGLARLKITEMPSRFIIYDGKEGELEKIRQSLLGTNWENLSGIEIFHAPMIEILTFEQKISAVSLAGASELSEVEKIIPITSDNRKKTDYVLDEEEPEAVDKENIVEPEEEISPEDFGFVLGEDITKKELDKEAYTVVNEQNAKAQSTDILDEKVRKEEKEEQIIENKQEVKSHKEKFFIFKGLNILVNIFKKIFGRKILAFGILAFLVLLGGLFALWWYYPKASVTIYLSSKKLEEDFTIFVTSDISEPDFSESVLPGELVTKTVGGERTASATGIKVVGDKASGEVILYRVGSKVTLSSGTVLSGPNGLDYTLDDTVNIASGSAGSPGETNAKVTALDLGAEYNLASGTTFTVEGYSTSDVEAKNQESFSGGSSREISAISEDDRSDLQEKLLSELVQKAIDEIKEETDSNKLMIEDSVEEDLVDVKYSHEVGEEASTLKLEMSIDVGVLVINKENIAGFTKELLEDKVPEGFVLRSEQIKSDFDYQGQEDGKYVLGVAVDANLLPAIEPEEIKNKIIGKYTFLAEEYFKEDIPGFVRAEIILDPGLPGRLGTLPHVSDNIEVAIASER